MQILRINSMLAMKVSGGEEETLVFIFCALACVTWLIQETKLGDGGGNLGWQSEHGCVGSANTRRWNQLSLAHIMGSLGGKPGLRRGFDARI